MRVLRLAGYCCLVFLITAVHAQKPGPFTEIYLVDKATGWVICVTSPENPAGQSSYRLIGRFGPGEPDAQNPGICAKSGKIYASDTYHHQVAQFANKTGKNQTTYGHKRDYEKEHPDNRPLEGEIALPGGITADGKGRLLIATGYGVVRIDDISGANWMTTHLLGSHICVDAGDRIYAALSNSVTRFNSALSTEGRELRIKDKGTYITGIATDAKNRLYICDRSNSKIIRVDDMDGDGQLQLTSAGGKPLAKPAGLALDVKGRIYVLDTGNKRIVRVDDMTGKSPKYWPYNPFINPQAICVVCKP